MPESFKDNQGREYRISLTLGKIRSIREVYPCDVFNHEDWQSMSSSLLHRLGFIWHLVKDQAESFGLDVDGWELALQGDGITQGVDDAFFRELANFYQQYDQQALLILTTKQQEMMKGAKEKVTDPKFLQMMDRELAKLFSDGAT